MQKKPNHETSKKSDLDKWKNYTDTVGVWTFLSSPVWGELVFPKVGDGDQHMGNVQEIDGWQAMRTCISLCSYLSHRQWFITGRESEEKHTGVGTGCFGTLLKSSVSLWPYVAIPESRHFPFTAPAPRESLPRESREKVSAGTSLPSLSSESWSWRTHLSAELQTYH